MTDPAIPTPSSSSLPFDPADWDATRRLGHRMVDEMLAYLAGIGERPVWSPVPAEVRKRLAVPLPEEGMGEQQAYEDFVRDVLPYPVGNIHPRFWGWVIGSGTPLGAMAEFLAATMNPNVSGLQGAPRYVETQVLQWLAEFLGVPGMASGVLVSGGSMANFIGLATGLQARAGFAIASEGLARAPKPPVFYASTGTHFSVDKAARLLGIGQAGYRKIPVDAEYRIDLAALEQAIAEDRAADLHPFAVVGNAGTVNTGAFDDLQALAALAEREGLWFHVDGAFGAFAAIVPDLAPLVRGMERADSLAFDVHKWMLVPIEAGAVLIRDAERHRAAFAVSGGYVAPMEGGIGVEGTHFAERGVELTRGFRALKVWLSLKAYGAAAYRALVAGNVALAQWLVREIVADPELELLAPAPLNVVCFRATPRGVPESALDALNRRIVVALHETGTAAPSYTTLNGRFAIRVAITNHRTRKEDLAALLAAVRRLSR